jgi:hypothetical protein
MLIVLLVRLVGVVEMPAHGTIPTLAVYAVGLGLFAGTSIYAQDVPSDREDAFL